MVTRALLKAEIDHLQEEDLDIVYSLIKSIIRQYDDSSQQTFLTKLEAITIQGPADFSRNIERYLKLKGQEAVPALSEYTEKH